MDNSHYGRGCQQCSNLTYNQQWYDTFGVALCNGCKSEEELINKSSAKEHYLLTDTDFKKLGSITKENPRKKGWSDMRLYLLSQVEAASDAKYGGPEGREQHRRDLLDVRQEHRAQRRVTDSQKEAREQALQERVKRKLEKTVAENDRSITGEELDSKTGKVQRIYDDGVRAEVEEI